MFMKHFFNTLFTWLLIILSCCLFYVAVTFPFSFGLANIVVFVTACFVLVQACGLIDREQGFGKHNKDNAEPK